MALATHTVQLSLLIMCAYYGEVMGDMTTMLVLLPQNGANNVLTRLQTQPHMSTLEQQRRAWLNAPPLSACNNTNTQALQEGIWGKQGKAHLMCNTSQPMGHPRNNEEDHARWWRGPITGINE